MQGFCSEGIIIFIHAQKVHYIGSVFCLDYFVHFGESIGKERAELERVWESVLGRYSLAMRCLVLDALHESQNPVEKVKFALQDMRTLESAQHAAKAVKEGLLTFSQSFKDLSYLYIEQYVLYLMLLYRELIWDIQ